MVQHGSSDIKDKTMCSNAEILACTAQELGIHVHGSHEGAIYLWIIPITIALLAFVKG